MKITVLHGEDVLSSRHRLSTIVDTLRTRGWEIRTLTTFPKDGLASILSSSQTLFHVNTLFILEQVNAISSKDLASLATLPPSSTTNLLMWQEGPLSEKVKKALPAAARIEVFDLPKTLFTFLESFIPGNAKTAIAFLEKTIETQPLELVFSVFSKHIRDLYWARVSPETLPYPSWRLQKLGRQARAFDQEQLASFLRQLAEIDISVKTESQSLLILLDLFVVKALESS